jgi:SAM-dependent methyltransferase
VSEPEREREREPAEVVRRYARRAASDRYHPLNPDVWQTQHERQRALIRLFTRIGWRELASKRVLEVGCGSGGNLLEMLRLGFRPEHLVGVELLAERIEAARHVLPASLALHAGDALALDLPAGGFDAVLVSTVFSSLLDDAFQQRLADAMWRWVAPGGGVLWYDFTVDNPRNPDVRGVPLARVNALFPQGRLQARRVTLAPPIARAVTRWHPSLYTLLNTLVPLRTHVLAWIEKPASI